VGNLTGFETDKVTPQLENLFQLRPVRVIFEHGTAGQRAALQPAMNFIQATSGLEIGRCWGKMTPTALPLSIRDVAPSPGLAG
jgi:hypothetical protein